MGPEINIDSILALEKQIEEGLGDVIQLKRARNSLLNISTRVPPELLGQVFRWNATPVGNYGEVRRGSYNFLLVSHGWFEVASSTPELWIYWGNTLKLWSQRYQRSGTAPLDLVLFTHTYHGKGVLDGPLRDALRNRAASGSVRSVQLHGWDMDQLHSVISSLTLADEEIRDSSIESLTLESTDLDISTFLTRHRFPKLRILRLSTHARVSSWDHFRLQATSLTTLSLNFAESDNPTTSQLFSILASYPNLQDLALYETVIPHNDGDGPTFRAPLRRLRKLCLVGDCYHVIRLLDRLEYPGTLDSVDLHLLECPGEAVSEFLEPYLRDHIRCDGRFLRRPGIQVSCTPNFVSFELFAFCEFNAPTVLPGRGYPSVSFVTVFRDGIPPAAGEKLCTGLITVAPGEQVVYFRGELSTRAARDMLVAMPNIENLYLIQSVVSDMFLQPDPLSPTKLLPSLRRLYLDYFTLRNDDDWTPLIAYLTRQTSGGQAVSLRLIRGGSTPIPPEVVRDMQGLVQELDLGYSDDEDGG